jgi:hypothetical protein
MYLLYRTGLYYIVSTVCPVFVFPLQVRVCKCRSSEFREATALLEIATSQCTFRYDVGYGRPRTSTVTCYLRHQEQEILEKRHCSAA